MHWYSIRWDVHQIAIGDEWPLERLLRAGLSIGGKVASWKLANEPGTGSPDYHAYFEMKFTHPIQLLSQPSVPRYYSL